MQVMTPLPWIGPLTTNIIVYTAYEINILILQNGDTVVVYWRLIRT